jgi:hypothetical protein
MQTTTEEENWTYEERLAKLAAMGFHTHEIHVRSWRYNVDEVIKCNSEADARELALMLVEAGRETHDEHILTAKYIDDYVGVEECYSHEDVCHPDGEQYGKGWHVIVSCKYPRAQYDENAIAHGNRHEFVFGHRFGANRMANPRSKVFLWIGGRDCDGYRYGSVYEFDEIWDASKWVLESQSWADGLEGYSVIDREYFETFS